MLVLQNTHKEKRNMTFKTGYRYKLRDGIYPREDRTKPGGTLEEFQACVADILARHGDKPEFKFTASFG